MASIDPKMNFHIQLFIYQAAVQQDFQSFWYSGHSWAAVFANPCTDDASAMPSSVLASVQRTGYGEVS
ncbi:MAG: hypothetical protein P8Q36_14135 [Alphaproteobacteria bacterium]|jgi:hypothetical protein|nr:hypothetical protein [Alphaproteobacteria bacterium]